MKYVLILALALVLPACGGDSGGNSGSPSVFVNPDKITISVANGDTIPYYLSVWEFVNGTPTSEIRICWPIPGRTTPTPTPTQQEGFANFHADSAVYSHAIILYHSPPGSGIADSETFVKGSGQLLLVVTILNGLMTVQPTQF